MKVSRLFFRFALVGLTGLITWAFTRNDLYWMSESELSRVALLSLESDALILRETLDALQEAATRYRAENGRPAKTLADLIGDSRNLCGTLPAGFRSWAAECGTYSDGLGWFGFIIRGDPEPRVTAHGCRWFGSKLGCVAFPDPGPPVECVWCAERSRSIDGWRITLEPPPQS